MTGGPSRTEVAALLALLAAVTWVYLPGLAGEPLDWDDPIWLSDPVVGAAPAEAIRLAFGTVRDHNWVPLLRLSFAAQLALGGPTLLHAVDLGLFLATTAGVWVFLRRLGLSFETVVTAVTAWALHPTRVECVAWLTGLKDVQSGAALALAAVLATLPRTAFTVAGTTAACAIAATTKAATFPVVLLIGVAVGAAVGRREAALRVGPGAALAVLAAAWGAAVWGPPPELDDLSLPARALAVHGAFAAKLLPLAPSAALTPLPSLPAAAAWSAAVVVPMAALSLRDARHRLALATWILPLAPFLGLVHMAFWGSDRHLLFALLGPAISLGLLVADQPRPVVNAAVLGLLLAFPTRARVPEWHDSLALWTAEARRPGDHWVRGHKLGTALGRAGRFPEAVAAYDRSLALNPDDDPTFAHRLLAALAADGWSEADGGVVRFLEPPPADPRAWLAAADALRRAGRPDLAAEAVRRAERRANPPAPR